jgi:hypothetical protein
VVILPEQWVVLASAIEVAIVVLLAVTATPIAAPPVIRLAVVLIAAAFFALALDQINCSSSRW